MFARVALCGLVLVSPVLGDAGVCQPIVVRQAVVNHGYVAATPVQINYGGHVAANVGYSHVGQAFGHTFYPQAYDGQALFVYKVRDEEKEALARSNERALKSLAEIAESQARLLEAAQAKPEEKPAAANEEAEEPQKAKAPAKSAAKKASSKPPKAAATSPDAVARKLLKQSCTSCHSGAKAKGGFILSLPDDDLEPFNDPVAKIRINTVIQAGEMPPGKPFDAEQKKLIAAWAKLTREELREAAKANAPKTDA